jgi:sulfur relay (sulfurtransferase) complex TusBCD TusD component (DsrE family)
MARTLFILNNAPYGSERSYNALRLACALLQQRAG